MPKQFLIETTLGNITVELFDDTPKHRDNFEKLVEEKYYDGIRFHRVIKDFMIQGGDPLSKDDSQRMMHGTGGPNYRVPAEIKHANKRGTLAAARDNNPQKASSGSQFYINHNDNLFLDGEYTVFGVVVSGIEVVDKIANVNTDMRDNPIEPVTMSSVRAV
ncbi:peptidyl-prolyl cis-trans isomerase cyclophilin type [Chloroherpeton thalassium ATCC 35110]|uniref:Peptidyl-prolyl cis-trans isomerase n=1 Tax=Chloroherpeton thalassium (strain ATCC 35110 / GB-78) TaxID=517418 RepID=B3QSR9_CHLT3|nr:peptidylprolyl isomerase [Chloroherpeton thalassium]ACF14116.1 peptidyl-prolyl cis-trans isomerase cyclophilin type [Chloroherpeton thalassium ATCC 35110]